VIDIDLMPGGLIAAITIAASMPAHCAARAQTTAARIKLWALSAATYTVAVAVPTIVAINGDGLWFFAAGANGLCVLLAVFHYRDAVKDAKTDAAKAKRAARPPVPLHQMTPLDYTPTKETNR